MMRRSLAVLADLASAAVGLGLIRMADTLPIWADLACTFTGAVCLWLCLLRWPWEKPKARELTEYTIQDWSEAGDGVDVYAETADGQGKYIPIRPGNKVTLSEVAK